MYHKKMSFFPTIFADLFRFLFFSFFLFLFLFSVLCSRKTFFVCEKNFFQTLGEIPFKILFSLHFPTKKPNIHFFNLFLFHFFLASFCIFLLHHLFPFIFCSSLSAFLGFFLFSLSLPFSLLSFSFSVFLFLFFYLMFLFFCFFHRRFCVSSFCFNSSFLLSLSLHLQFTLFMFTLLFSTRGNKFPVRLGTSRKRN